jgi:type VI secretion system protein ImpK
MTSIAIAPSTTATHTPSSGFTLSLKDLLEDGIYLLLLLKNGNAPNSSSEFNRRIDQFLSQFEKNARNLGKAAQAVAEAKYAFCALMDEIILSSEFSLREEWERAPLQLRMFGEHLAGDRFFDKLEILRDDPAAHIETLEVFHTCLLLGFQGKYLLEGPEKLNYLINRVTQEITQVRGGKAGFAPNWKLPQRFQQYVRHELPLWLFFSLLAAVGVAVFLVYFTLLGNAASDLKERQSQPASKTAGQASPSIAGKKLPVM